MSRPKVKPISPSPQKVNPISLSWPKAKPVSLSHPKVKLISLSTSKVKLISLLSAGLGVACFVAPGPALAEQPDGGTAVSVQVADGGDTRIEVTRGGLKVRAGGEEAHLAAGQGAQVKRGGKVKKISLLPAPPTVGPEDGDHLNTVDVVLSWKKVVGAQRYRLAVASDAGFAHKIVELEATDASSAPVHLDAGTYFWRVAAVDGDGLEGSTTRARRFIIDTTPPKLKAGRPKWR
jgi:hypothetical protein